MESIVKQYCQRFLSYLLVVFLGFSLAPAKASDPVLQSIGTAFQLNLPSNFKYQAGGWMYLDPTACYLYEPTCFGDNPLGSYGLPTFLDPATQTMSNILQMNANEAVVMILRTPQQMRYFGFTQYLYQKGATTMTSPTFASLSDSLNLLKIGTSGSATPGQNVFNQYTALVWTGDVNTFNTVKATFAKFFPTTAVNFIPLPVNLPVYPLQTGYGPGRDTYQFIMRTALPADPAALASYVAEAPFIVSKVGPTQAVTPSPAPTVGYASEKASKTEDPLLTLQAGLLTLNTSIISNYGAKYNLKPQVTAYSSRTGWDCISNNTTCNGDTHDALYSTDTSAAVQFTGPNDFVIISGVNHQLTGFALYESQTVYDTVKLAGITAVPDTLLTSASAAYHAGVRSPRDPRNLLFKNLFAYMISYNCSGRSYCLQIPPPTPSNPVGLPPGSPFFLVGRSYVNPLTGVRPSSSQIVNDSVSIGFAR